MSEIHVIPADRHFTQQAVNPWIKEESPIKQLRICFVLSQPAASSTDWQFYELLEKLSQSGCQITLLMMQSQYKDSISQQFRNSKTDIQLAAINYSGPSVSSLLPAVHSYHVMHWMLENSSQFDLVLFPLTGGLAYYTLLAKRQGWAFQKLACCVDCSSCTLWHKHVHKQWIDHLDDLAADFLEKESVRLADCIVSQEGEVLNWMKANGWQQPQQVVFIPKEFDETDYLNLYLKLQADHFEHASLLSAMTSKENKPLVSICLTHFNRPHYLAQALESIRNQDYSSFEVVLVDDGSTHPEAIAYLDLLTEEFESKGWKIIRNKKNLFPGAARNLGARQCRGDYLLFMDDDNYAKRDQISIFVKVAQQVNADILTCAMDVFSGSQAPDQELMPTHRFLPMGAAASVGLYLNMYGDMNALIKRHVYEELSGLTEERGVGGEDWEFYSRAVLQGYHLETIPQALFWYRDTPSSITKTTHLYANSLRGIRSYLHSVPPALQSNLILSQGQQEKLHKLLIEHNSLGKLLKRCWHLFSSRAWRALRQPHRSIKKILGLLRQ